MCDVGIYLHGEILNAYEDVKILADICKRGFKKQGRFNRNLTVAVLLSSISLYKASKRINELETRVKRLEADGR